MKKVVIKKDSNTGERKEAFLGAIIGAVTGIAGSIISGKKKKRAEEQAFKLAQDEQNRIDGIQQAQAMSSQYANQDYVDQYLNKVTLKNGGKVKVKQSKKGDRMSQQNDVFEEKEATVVISNEDVKNVRDFFMNFKIDMPDALVEVLNDFQASNSFENQVRVKAELCKLMVSSSHPLFKDDLFSQVIDNSQKVVMEAKFQEDLVAVLRKEEESK